MEVEMCVFALRQLAVGRMMSSFKEVSDMANPPQKVNIFGMNVCTLNVFKLL